MGWESGSERRSWLVMLAAAWVVSVGLLQPVPAASATEPPAEVGDADYEAMTNTAKARVELQRYAAALSVGNPTQVERSLRRLLALERSWRNLNNLGLFLSDRGDFSEAQQLLGEAVAKAPADLKGFYRANVALNLRRQFLDGAAEEELAAALKDLADYSGGLNGWPPSNLARSRTLVMIQRT